MQPLHIDINPFALMLDPQSVLVRITHSERLERLHKRICRPLDRPGLPGAAEAADAQDDGEAGVGEPAALDDDAVGEFQGAGAETVAVARAPGPEVGSPATTPA